MMNNFENPKARYEAKIADRLARVQEKLDFDKDILDYVNETMGDTALDDLKKATIEALESDDRNEDHKNRLGVLAQSITIKIGYLGEKSHDSEEDEEYLVKLGLMRDRLLEIVG